MKSPGAAVTTDQLPAVLTHRTLVVVAVGLQRKQQVSLWRRSSEPGRRQKQLDYRVCVCRPLVAKRIPSRDTGASRPVQLIAGTEHTADFDALPGTSCHVTRQSGHKTLDCFSKPFHILCTHQMASGPKQTPVSLGSVLSPHCRAVALHRRMRRKS